MRLPAPLSLRFCLRTSVMLGAAALLFFLNAPVRADDTPFDLESSSWMSFDRYKDKPANWLAPDQRNEAVAQPVIVPPPVLPASMPVVNEPARPLITPVMPGLNRNFDIKIDTTEDDHLLPVTAPVSSTDNPQINLPDNNWQKAADAARNSKNGTTDNTTDSSTFTVRYTALPSWFAAEHKTAAMTPVPAAGIPPVKAPPPTVMPPSVPAVSTADAAACAALDAYKKRQLEAIESDRQTLSALQNAIARLGLQKQLDFLPGVGGSLNAQANGPANTSAPVKN